jgi:hypothetical protein
MVRAAARAAKLNSSPATIAVIVIAEVKASPAAVRMPAA